MLVVSASQDGTSRVLATVELRHGRPFVLDVTTADADWCWLTLKAPASGQGRLTSAEWSTRDVHLDGRPRSMTVVVPTFRAESEALAQLARLTAPELEDAVARVVLIDQGGTLAAHPGATEALAAAGERVLLVEQPNLGGSGGYARGLHEANRRWPEDPVFLHDDDARAQPETLRRLAALAALAPHTFFGTNLLDVDAPTRLQALAEGVEPRTFRWGPTDGVDERGTTDVSAGSPDTWRFTRPDDRAEYAGWWGCLVPAGAAGRLGLVAPYFLKWDDAEYGLRAGQAGFETRNVPGCAVWSMSWASKGTSASWSSWPMHRNRLATAAAYHAGPGVLVDSLLHQVKHVLSLQYATAELWNAALREFVSGPGWLAADLTLVRPRAQALIDAMPSPPVPAPGGVAGSTGTPPLGRPRAAVRAVAGLFRPADTPGPRVADLASPSEFGWVDGLGSDAVVFADGTAPLLRDPRRARRALVRAFVLHGRAMLRWHGLRRSYGSALPVASSLAAWQERFASSPRH
ncbi:Galactofuranosylgalactofuranosylrhamnosyl-N-acetylglucosaminyl-diphospho-decaprenol beta-1,5/1,6-galactofuranosyltransferase [Luteimicrobium xylanilyticum]|uniref:Galactofuranosylgalactofuranosylrhamnosyl-N-acetylglucosaminyl-diphospho-decaprenol beta-1,5/1,6-galactofuranosyltransferase n=2 Tax=Luteimicrobium xylanilyticum TaxID=1133546 RepID=A0A5P9QCJ0_9MICO|nr:glycosyltransferase [Luteimicrobium xylanilyticum]QFU99097.1 Galactofuranosylgalactofuranosylrhamnosyl-N-acetylglucosaminyl-diphospho-decaprenol beta-1,5/1,6-galactofuranosyltransferase [Luteimicrobium xylanilyticum]